MVMSKFVLFFCKNQVEKAFIHKKLNFRFDQTRKVRPISPVGSENCLSFTSMEIAVNLIVAAMFVSYYAYK